MARYFENQTPPLLTVDDPKRHLIDTITRVIREYPPQDSWAPDESRGIYRGPTSIAYLCLHLAEGYPDLLIEAEPLTYWAKSYLRGTRQPPNSHVKEGGVMNEDLAFTCVNVAVNQDAESIECFRATVPRFIDAADGVPCEWTFGFAGTLVCLRIVERRVPELKSEVEAAKEVLIKKVLAQGPPWLYFGKFDMPGAAHGGFGIITQIILSDPRYAVGLEAELGALIDQQLEGGNWLLDTLQPQKDYFVQFCHGAPGVVIALMAIRDHFPALQPKIDRAIASGRACIWQKGL
ncbi:hypothetical protein MMC25_002848 [Agyrium rufum]|nr:hypothetical protein [Agyrium rufum]